MNERFQPLESEARDWFPQTIDVNPTARCNLDCSFCWGPDHSIPDGLDTEDWKRTIDFFSSRGTHSVVFTGGEPLLRPDIGELIKHGKDRDMRVTLSTNTLLLARRADAVLPHIDEIGVPLDGSSMQNNVRMRLGTKSHFQKVVQALRLVRDMNSNIETTIRTVVSAINKDDIQQIGTLLSSMPELFDRWKIYQFAPVSIGAQHEAEHTISHDHFNEVAQTVCDSFPQLNTQVYPSEQRSGRYVFVGPEGNIFGVDDSGNYTIAGNVLSSDETEIYQGVRALLSPEKNQLHGQHSSSK